MRRRKALPAALTVAVIALSACRDDQATRPLAPITGPLAQQSVAFANPHRPPLTLDEEYLQLEDSIPGFAGLYYDESGTPVVNLVDEQHGQVADRIASRFLKERSHVAAASGAKRHKKVKHDYRTLMRWRGLARDHLFTRPEVLALDIDEAKNLLRIGVRSPADIATISRDAERLGMQVEVVTMIVPDPIDPPPPEPDPGLPEDDAQAGSPSGSVAGTLTDLFTNPTGGVMIDARLGACTLGVNVYKSSNVYGRYDYQPYFITNAHCTNAQGYVENTDFFQPTYSNGAGRFVGSEVRETLWRGRETHSGCPAPDSCSLADVAMVQYTAGVYPDYARIARPTSAGTGNSPGSVTLANPLDRFRIVDSMGNNPPLGTRLSKVGHYTGWTTGTIFETCTDWKQFNPTSPKTFYVLCQYSMNATTHTGDSGAPVFFQKAGNDVSFVGIVWGGGVGRARFSVYPYISYELLDRDKPYACGGVFLCWPRLMVSGP
jgi:hypothetical protein